MLWAFLIYCGSTDELGGNKSNHLVHDFLCANFPVLDWKQIAKSIFYLRKCCHVTEYLILSTLFLHGLLAFTLSENGRRPKCCCFWGKVLLTFFVCVGYAASDEWHQSFTIQRCGSPVDVLIDSSGVLLGIGLVFILCKFRPFSSNDDTQ